MKRVIIGSAGHVDHGKTSLIKALTGVDCDRLKEEKERGLTIELGFTSLKLPSGAQLGIVDVPGHIKFLKHMLSGASGIDLVLLVVAADEGVMPQTIEHTLICELLGVNKGIVALTKIDLAPQELIEIAISEVRDFLSTTIFKGSPIIPVSSVTGQGIKALINTIEQQLPFVKEKEVTGIPILPIDRVFTIKGFGTVVTGTLLRGKIIEGQDVEILPSDQQARIRGLQVHSKGVKVALAGMRTAVNLQGISKQSISRGQWLVPRGGFKPTKVIDAKITLKRKPKKGEIRLYIGTAEVTGFMNIYKVEGQDVARIRLKDKILASFEDRFILREVSQAVTIGGGIVLNPYPRRRFSGDVIIDLLCSEWDKRVLGVVKDAGIKGISKSEICSIFSFTGPELGEAIDSLISREEIVCFDSKNNIFVSPIYIAKLKKTIKKVASAFHDKYPSCPGISKEHLRSSTADGIDPKLFHRVFLDLVKKGEIEDIGSSIRIKGFTPTLGHNLEDLSNKVYDVLDRSGFEPPAVDTLASSLGTQPKDIYEVLGFMGRDSKVVKIKENIYLTDRFADELKTKVNTFLMENQTLSPVDMKAIVGVSRKYAIPYLEYLDRIRFTIRVGNKRKLALQGRNS